MVLRLLLVASIILQAVAVVVALRLMKTTRYNVSWILITAAILGLFAIHIAIFVPMVGGKELELSPYFFAWMSVAISLCLAVGTMFIGKIFESIRQFNYQRQLAERRILTTVLNTEEKERSRFSKDLHDGLGPLLSSARMSLTELAKAEHSEQDAQLLADTTYVIEEAIRSLREISNNLSPHTLQTFGLGRALGSFVSRSTALKASSAPQVRFETNLQGERFDSNVEVIVYRVICELFNNSLKHSGARNIDLVMNYDNGLLRIDYADNGKGFNPQGAMDRGMGLSNVISRINSLDGTIDIKSVAGEGMSVVIVVNMNQIYDNSNEKI